MSGPSHASSHATLRRAVRFLLLAASVILALPAVGSAAPSPDAAPTSRTLANQIGNATGPLAPVVLAGGQTIQIGAVPGADATAAQAASVLGGLLHGAEMQGLEVRVVSTEMAEAICKTTACYLHDSGTIVIPASTTVGGMPFATALAHEYGHHIAHASANPPWAAIDWGPKRWSTAVGVCSGVAAGSYSPGDEGAGYWDNPGEAFAQAYALSQFPGSVPWWWHLPPPDASSLAALRTDVTNPWRPHPATMRFAPRRRGRQPIAITPALDGEISASVLRGAGDQAHPVLNLRSSTGVLLARSRAGRRRARLSYTACQSGPLLLSLTGARRSNVRVRVAGP
jgi:hypothetical protein